MSMYINNYFKCKWIKFSNQKTDWLNGYKNKTHIYAVYKKATSDLKIHRLRGWKNIQPRLLYPARISFKIDGEIKSFSDKQKLREFSTTKPALQQMLKGLIS